MTTSIPPGSIDDRADVVITSPTNGQVLKYNGTNWVNAAESGGGGSGDLVLISTTTVSSPVSSVDFTDLDTATYSNFIVIFSGISPSATSNLYMRTSSQTGSSPTFDTGATDYEYVFGTQQMGASTYTITSTSSGNSTIDIFGQTATGASVQYSGIVKTVNNNESKEKHLDIRAVSRLSNNITYHTDGGAERSSTNAIKAFRFYMSAGNISSGTFKLYGIT